MKTRTKKYLHNKSMQKWDKKLRWQEQYIKDHPDEWISKNRRPFVVGERMIYNQLKDLTTKEPITDTYEPPMYTRVTEGHVDENGNWYETVTMVENKEL